MIYIIGSLVGSGFSGTQILAFVLAYILVIVVAFGVHEFAHAFVAYKLGDPTPKALGRLTINPLKHMDALGIIGFLVVGFGWAKPVPVNPFNFKNYKKDMFLVSIAGVVTNIVFAFIFSGIYLFFVKFAASDANFTSMYSNGLMYFIHFFLQYSIILNIALFVFNLLPIYPLDGFNAIQALTRTNNRFINFMYKYGAIIMLIIIISPMFDVLYGLVTNNITNVFFKFWGLFI